MLSHRPVSGWHVPCWLQSHGTQGEYGPPLGLSRVKPGSHSSQNCPMNPSGQAHSSTQGAGGVRWMLE